MAREIALLTNPTSGKGLGARTAAIALPRLLEAGFRVRELQGDDAAEAELLARQAVADGVETLVVVGGDGMVHLAVQALAHSATALGIIPAGTGNDAARTFHIPRSDPQAAADVIVAGQVRTVDLAKAGPTYVVNVVSAGFDAVVNERANRMRWPRGQMRYNLATLAELRTFQPIDYVLDLDGSTHRVQAMLVAIGNGPSFGGGLRITEGALLDDGLLDVVLFHPVSKPDLLRTYPKLFRGTHTSHPAYEHHRVRQATVAAHGIVAYGDGERLASLPLTVTAVPAALRVVVGHPRTVDPVSTPSERYARFRADQGNPVLSDFRAMYDFGLDDFQVRACRALEAGDGVLVAAPTGSGKTIVGEFAIHLALHQGRKAFYTTPIKALSNQKYADLVARYGADKVGLLTGDNTVNGEAPVVVMTTEVLRNMLYAGSGTLSGLGFVVMDEVHYLADRSRGAVWEEVIIHLPESVAVVSLSATVSNAEEFGDWMNTVRGSTTTIVEETRPVPLYQHVMVGRRLHDLFEDGSGFADPDSRVNPELERVARDDWRRTRTTDRRGKGERGRGPRRPPPRGGLPSRYDVVERLERDGLLPAIYFIFSRVGCDAAVQQCLDANLRLTTPAQRDEIVAFVQERCSHLPEEDLNVLGYHDFLDGLSRGVAAHHAGMLPTFKECVEELFESGRCRVVFATETLALGINMPARSVVIEKLSKWNGETHADITPGEYTQLTGRAGRRGIDVEGHGVVLWTPGMEPKSLAGLASTRTYPLRSSFRPSYNMAVNLVHQTGRATARELLESSFAQFQADRAVVGLARQLRKADEGLTGYAESATCDKGDFMEYAGLRRRLSDIEAGAARARRADKRQEIVTSLEALRPGDVIEVPTGKYAGFAVVIDPGTRADLQEPRPYVVTESRHARRLAMTDFNRPAERLTRMKVPRNFNGRNAQSRRELAISLQMRAGQLDPGSPSRRERTRAQASGGREDPEVARVRAAIRSHPCHSCPDRESHARWAERHHKLERETATLRRRIESRTNTIARQFDRVCDVLTSLGYLVDDEVGEAGRTLRRIHTEMDLVAAECLRSGLWDDLDPAELAAALSVLVFEARRPDDAHSPRLPKGRVRDVIADTVSMWADLDRLERENRLDFLREPDLGFAWAAYRWAMGAGLDEVLNETDLAAGDFVRWIKQLLDLAGQVADAAATSGKPELRENARLTIGALRRGVVAYSSLTE